MPERIEPIGRRGPGGAGIPVVQRVRRAEPARERTDEERDENDAAATWDREPPPHPLPSRPHVDVRA